MLIPTLLFLFGLLLLVRGGDLFVDGATGIALRFRMPEALIGATVVSIGTTLPEVTVSATSAFRGVGGMSYGNAIGSIICNTALVAAVTITLRPKRVDRQALLPPILFFFGALAVYLFSAYYLRRFSGIIGAILLLLFVAYITVSVLIARADTRVKRKPCEADDDTALSSPSPKKIQRASRELLLLAIGAAAIAFGADLLVENGQLIAKNLNIPETIVALLFISLGTSLPELVTAITALVKGHAALSLGNIIGANFLNLTLVTGISALVGPFDLPVAKEIAGIPSSLIVDLPITLLVMLLLTLPTVLRAKVYRIQGILLLSVYVVFSILTLSL